jgi:protein disulfide-isomerase
VLAQQSPFPWESNLENAKRLAAQSNRLVLVHFWATWCGPCKKMEAEVFSQPGVAAAIQANYVPVKINADQMPETAKQFGITGLPTDVVITPQGQVVDMVGKAVEATQYVAHFNQVADTARQNMASAPASIPGRAPDPSIAVQSPPSNSVGQGPMQANPVQANPVSAAPPYTQQAVGSQGAPSTYQPSWPPASGDVAASQPQSPNLNNPPPGMPASLPPNAASNLPPNAPLSAPPAMPPNVSAPTSAPLCLDGFCPVTLIDKTQWAPGDRRYGAIHRGRTYLFAGPKEQSLFLADPDRYAPMLSGNDVVLAKEQGQAVSGMRGHGVVYSNHIFLFADEVSLGKFSKNPAFYAGQYIEALQAASHAAQPYR